MWAPKRAIFEADSLEYPRGREIRQRFVENHVPIEILGKGKRISGMVSSPPARAWADAKDTVVIKVRNVSKFETCKPSAHYQLPLVSSCPGKCEYCYLHTTLGKKPYLRVYANLDEILDRAGRYVQERLPEETVFEGAATSDPVPIEPFSHSLADTIVFFGKQENARFRFVTKFDQVDSLLHLPHNGKTRFRFSVNSAKVIRAWEHGTPDFARRLEAVNKVSKAGYPMGIIIAPIVLGNTWEEGYCALLHELSRSLGDVDDLRLELILHRYTERAKSTILEIFPHSTLPMDKEERVYKYGQFGYGKWVYPKDVYKHAEEFFREQIAKYLPKATIEYLV